MSILKNLTSDATIANESDRVSSGGVLPTGSYLSTVKLAYVTTANSGAIALNLQLETDTGKQIRQQLWMNSGTAKGGKNYYEKDGVKNYLPGFLLAQSLTLLTVGKEISDLDTEEKVVNLWNSEAKKEEPTKVQMVMELLNTQVNVGLVKQVVDKNVKDNSGNYVPSGETREENEIDKFFRAKDNMTTAEIRAQAEKAAFIDTWNTKHPVDFVRNKAKGANGATPGAPRAAASTGAAKKPTASLFS